jgi:hypothetical protein
MSHLSVASDAIPVAIATGALLIGLAVLIAVKPPRLRVMRLAGIAAPLSVLALQAPLASPALAASPPPVTYSRYVGTLSMYTMGCNQGRHADSIGQPREIAILSFGDPGWNGSGTFGAWDNRLPGGFATISQIQGAVQSYMQGFWNCTVANSHSFMEVAPGVTNHGGAGTYAHGQAWGAMIGNLQSWIRSNNFGSQLYALGAGDLEPSWGSVSQTESWVNGYSTKGQLYFDFGSADGCPPYGGCNNGWSQAAEYYVSWGATFADAVPEIFTESGSQAAQWESISLWGSYNGVAGAIRFSAAMSQYQACRDVGSSCSGEDNTPAQSWTQLTNAMNSNSRTAGSISYSTEVSYQNS